MSQNKPSPTSQAISIQDIPRSDRPRERLLRQGAGALSTAELLAILLRTGTQEENVLRLAERIIARFDGLEGLTNVTAAQLQQTKGLGNAKIAQILAAIEIGKRLMVHQSEERPLIESAADAARIVMDMGMLPQEHVRVILLDSGQRVVATPTVYIGTINASVLRISELCREAVIRNCPGMILAHNHPSGDPSPSPEDVDLTRTLNAACKLLDIQLLDHIILARNEWRSVRELGLAFG